MKVNVFQHLPCETPSVKRQQYHYETDSALNLISLQFLIRKMETKTKTLSYKSLWRYKT